MEGDDAITINYPLATGVTQVAVNAGGPGGSDSLTITGTAGVAEVVVVLPRGYSWQRRGDCQRR